MLNLQGFWAILVVLNGNEIMSSCRLLAVSTEERGMRWTDEQRDQRDQFEGVTGEPGDGADLWMQGLMVAKVRSFQRGQFREAKVERDQRDQRDQQKNDGEIRRVRGSAVTGHPRWAGRGSARGCCSGSGSALLRLK